MGSKDRRQLTEWTFSWYRLGNWLLDLDFESRLAIAVNLSADSSEQGADLINAKAILPYVEKPDITHFESHFNTLYSESVLPFTPQLSDGIHLTEYASYLLSQPYTWLRVLDSHQMVLDELVSNQIPFEKITESSLRLEPNAKITDLEVFREGRVIVQDLSSQETGFAFAGMDNQFWWDSCCGAGGKSILFLEQNPNSQILATDNRGSILENYAERLERSGFENFAFKKLDLTQPIKKAFPSFNGIIVDVPCSGSGTWGRSPEHICAITPPRISEYQSLQRSIVENALPYLRPDGLLVYITCSVFRQENEENVQYFVNDGGLKLVESRLINGTQRGSDNLFCAILQKIAS